MKFRVLFGVFLTFSAVTNILANDSDHAVELGVSYLDVSGFNAYGTDRSINVFEGLKHDDAVVYIGYRFTHNNWRVRVGFQDFGSFKRNGVSPNSDIFGDAEISTPVITPFQVQEDIKNFNLDLTRLFSINDDWTFEAGPSINYVNQRASVINSANQAMLRKISENKLRVGALMGINHAFNDQVDLGLNYRFNQSSDIDLHTLGLNLGWTF